MNINNLPSTAYTVNPPTGASSNSSGGGVEGLYNGYVQTKAQAQPQSFWGKMGSAIGNVAGDVGTGIKQTAQNLTAPIVGGAKNIASIAKGTAQAVGQDYQQGGQDVTNEMQMQTAPDLKTRMEGRLQEAGTIAKTALSPITNTINQTTQAMGNDLADNKTVQNAANSKTGQAITDTTNSAQQKYSDWATQHPEASKNLEATLNIGQLLLGAKGEEPIKSGLKTGLDTVADTSKPGLEAVKSDITTGAKATADLTKTGVKKVVDTGKSMLGRTPEALDAKANADALETVKPKLSPTEQANARAEGRGTTTGKIIKTGDIAPTTKEVEMGKVAQEAGVSSKNTADMNIQKMQDFQKASADKIRTGLRQADVEKPLNFNKAQFKGQVGSVMNGIEKPITLVGDNAKIAAKFKSAVMKLADTVEPSREGMLNLRQGLDTLIKEQLPSNIYTKDTALGQYMRSVREGLTNYTESKIPDGKLPDGSSFKGELRKQHVLYDAIDNVAEKAPKTGEPSNPTVGKIMKFGNKPIVKYGLGALGAEKIAKILGVPFLP